ncbi:MAG: peptidylprolyl isomerase [Bryobacteraceae bacterium]
MKNLFVFAAAAAVLPVALLSQTSTTAKKSTSPASATKAPAQPALPPVDLPSEPGTYAVFYTSLGNFVCRLFPEDAPKAVANFIGLATGTKAWTDPTTHQLKHTPLYSGTQFHRVIPDFMIQGGDPTATGMGSPGYQFPDEFGPHHDFSKAGILAMANSGPNTNGSQFFVTVTGSMPAHLNGKHTIFGEVVSGQDVVDKISQVPRDGNDKPNTPVKLIRVSIKKVPAPGTAPAAKPAAKTTAPPK